MVGLVESDVLRVQQWCTGQVPDRLREQMRVEVDIADRHLTIVERRPPWRAERGAEWTRMPVARLRYTKKTGLWSLYWRDQHQRFHAYDQLPPSADIAELLAEVDRDPTGIFWG